MTTEPQVTTATLDDVAEAIGATVLDGRRKSGYLNDRAAKPDGWWYGVAEEELGHELTAEERESLVGGVNAAIVKLFPLHVELHTKTKE